MAYLITINNNIYRIAANDTEKNEMNVEYPPYVAHQISDADYLKLKANTAFAEISNGNVVVNNITDSEEPSQKNLQDYHQGLIQNFHNFLIPRNENKSIYSTVETYKNYLSNLDYSTLTFPINSSWEKYCEDNSITYVNPLQLP